VLESEVKGVWVASGYRSYEKDEGLWNSYYPRYYKETAKARAKLPGGEHGDAAAKYLAKYIGKYKAAPGFSNHSNGMAVDLWTQEGTEKITADKSLQVRWKRTWVHKWLVKNAATLLPPLQESCAVAPVRKSAPLATSTLPPLHTVPGDTLSTRGGGLMVKSMLAVDEQPTGSGLVIRSE